VNPIDSTSGQVSHMEEEQIEAMRVLRPEDINPC
jgi:hypothetical protein